MAGCLPTPLASAMRTDWITRWLADWVMMMEIRGNDGLAADRAMEWGAHVSISHDYLM